MGIFSSHEIQENFTRYGDITAVKTTGASRDTAEQYNRGKPESLRLYKVAASEALAHEDEERMKKYKSIINSVGHKKGIDPALIAGIISRESRAGNALDNGWGDRGRAWGLMQVDVTSNGGGHTAQGAWDSEEHLRQGTQILIDFINVIQKKFPSWTKEEQLKGGIAAYNMGDGNVHSYDNVDANTTGGDYSNDVVARAQWYKSNRVLKDTGHWWALW